MKKVLKTKPLYKKIKDFYDEEITVPTLEERKKTLKDIRNLYKPLAKMNLDEQEDKYMTARQLKLEEIKKKREAEISNNNKHHDSLPYKDNLDKDQTNT